jgi:DNA-directed RNA polymerase specialized sigma24 family protein
MARDAEIERRLLNWARAKGGGLSGGLGFSRLDLAADTSSRGYREATIPIDACDADVTDQGVKALTPVLRETVVWLYLQGKSLDDVARRERITKPAVHARVWKAHAELRLWFAERERRASVERQRLDRLQRQAGRR